MNEISNASLRLESQDWQPIFRIVNVAQNAFKELPAEGYRSGGLTFDQYVRYLSMQYHLTKDVQRHFFRVAAHPSLASRKPLRDFLYRFALEEEPHFKVALDDLANLGKKPLSIPFDVELWTAYFYSIAEQRPFVRLGATCVLENLGPGVAPIAREMLAKAEFLNRNNSRFIEIHFHEALPHGDQIFEALRSASISSSEFQDCAEGAVKAAILYLRLASWVFQSNRSEADLEGLFPSNRVA